MRNNYVVRYATIILFRHKTVAARGVRSSGGGICPRALLTHGTGTNVQHRATKLISSLRKETYENRVKILGLTTLETRRLRGDIIEAFKIMKGLEDISWSKFFKMSSTKQLRGHSWKLYKRSVRLDIIKYSFNQRVINQWNLLPDELLECETVDNFKKKLDLHLGTTGDSNKQNCFFPRLLSSSFIWMEATSSSSSSSKMESPISNTLMYSVT